MSRSCKTHPSLTVVWPHAPRLSPDENHGEPRLAENEQLLPNLTRLEGIICLLGTEGWAAEKPAAGGSRDGCNLHLLLPGPQDRWPQLLVLLLKSGMPFQCALPL